MNVKSNRHISTIYNLIDGTLFYYEGTFYIKTTEYNVTKKLCGCVDINSGAFDWLNDNITVEYFEAEVILK